MSDMFYCVLTIAGRMRGRFFINQFNVLKHTVKELPTANCSEEQNKSRQSTLWPKWPLLKILTMKYIHEEACLIMFSSFKTPMCLMNNFPITPLKLLKALIAVDTYVKPQQFVTTWVFTSITFKA